MVYRDAVRKSKIARAVVYGTAFGLIAGTSMVLGATCAAVGYVGYKVLRKFSK
jgi:hypothetical protein